MSDTQEVLFRGGPDDGKRRRLHVTKCDGEEFVTRGGSVMGDAIPDRIHVFRDGEAHFVRWVSEPASATTEPEAVG